MALQEKLKKGDSSAATGTDGHAAIIASHSVGLAHREEAAVIDVTQQLKAINAACLEVLRQARADGQPRILLQATDRIARQLELQARLMCHPGMMRDNSGPTYNGEPVFVVSEISAQMQSFRAFLEMVCDYEQLESVDNYLANRFRLGEAK